MLGLLNTQTGCDFRSIKGIVCRSGAAGAALLLCLMSLPVPALADVVLTLEPAPDLDFTPWPGMQDPESRRPLFDLHRWIETDATTYQLGQDIHITQGITNEGNNQAVVPFRSEPAFDFYILSGDTRIDRSIGLRAWVYWSKTLSPGEVYSMEWTWNQTDLNRNPLPPGTYDIVGTTSGITTEYSPVARITIVPEPGTLFLATLGLVGVLLRKRRRSSDFGDRSTGSRVFAGLDGDRFVPREGFALCLPRLSPVQNVYWSHWNHDSCLADRL